MPNSKFWVYRCILVFNTFPTTTCFLKTDLRAKSYGLEKFWLFYPIYPMFSTCDFFFFLHILTNPDSKSGSMTIFYGS